jgi:hypothetical protein
MFRIDGHAFARAATPNRVALYIGADVWRDRADIAETVGGLEPGESVCFEGVRWDGRPIGFGTVRVTRET